MSSLTPALGCRICGQWKCLPRLAPGAQHFTTISPDWFCNQAACCLRLTVPRLRFPALDISGPATIILGHKPWIIHCAAPSWNALLNDEYKDVASTQTGLRLSSSEYFLIAVWSWSISYTSASWSSGWSRVSASEPWSSSSCNAAGHCSDSPSPPHGKLSHCLLTALCYGWMRPATPAPPGLLSRILTHILEVMRNATAQHVRFDLSRFNIRNLQYMKSSCYPMPWYRICC